MAQEQDPFDTSMFPCPSSKLIPDNNQKNCWSCSNNFSGKIFKSGKHHCRKCGNVVCGDCSKNKIRKHIVCKRCYHAFNTYTSNIEEQNKLEVEVKNPIFKIAISIDFGTDGLGVAYAIKGDDNIYVHDKWKTKNYGTIVKPKTIILLDDEENPAEIGLNAKHIYNAFTGNEQFKWMLFDRFKMSLYEEQLDDQKSNIKKKRVSIKDELTAVNGQKCSSEKIFVAVFKHIHKISKKYLKKQKIIDMKTVADNEIQWIVTVPAIWSDEAKQKMKNWIIKSGLVDQNISAQCKIVYEPDCAAVAIHNYMKRNNNIHYDKAKKKSKKLKKNQNDDNKEENKHNKLQQTQFEIGDEYILVDAGGGTVDIACHQVLGDFEVKEIFHPSGNKWGSCYIDDQYIEKLGEIFDKQWIDEFKNKAPNAYIKLVHYFQQAKESFYTNTNNRKHCVELPFKFLSFIEESIAKIVADSDEYKDVEPGDYDEYWVKNAKMNGVPNLVELDVNILIIDNSVWKEMFNYVMQPTINHIENLLGQQQFMKNCKFLCLVGGLSCSQYFQFRMKTEFGPFSGYALQIIIPERPMLSVVEGAALLGITNDFVKARRLRCHYGIIIGREKEDAIKQNVSDSYIRKHQKYNKFRNKWHVHGCVHILGAKNEEIVLNQTKTTYAGRENPTKNCLVKVFRSFNDDKPKTIDDGEIMATLNIEFKDQDEKNLEVSIGFRFSETMIKVYAYPIKFPNNWKMFALNYTQRL